MKLSNVDLVKSKTAKAHANSAQSFREPILNREQSPFNAAAGRRFKEIVKMLPDSGLAVDFRDLCCRTLLHVAALYRQFEITYVILNIGADPNARDNWGGTALSLARAQNSSKLLEILLDHGAQPNEYERYL